MEGERARDPVSKMLPLDLNLNDVPVYAPNTDDWNSVNCNFVNIDNLPTLVSHISFSILMINIRSCNKNFNQFLSYFCNYISFFFLHHFY